MAHMTLSSVLLIIRSFFRIKELDARDKLLKRAKINPGDNVKISIGGIDMELNSDKLPLNSSFSFALISQRSALDFLKEELGGSLDRYRIMLTISYTHIDPEFSSFATNTIANMFIEKLLDIRRYKTVAVLGTFEEQLKASQLELSRSEEKLRTFRERHPYLMLSSAGSDIVANLASNQSEVTSLDMDIKRINSFLKQRSGGDTQKRYLAYLEILSFLETRLIGGSQIYTKEFQDLLTRRNQLLADNYAPGHPMIQDIESRLSKISSEVDERIQQYYNDLISRKNKIDSKVKESEGRIRRLPRDELQLARIAAGP